MNLFLRMITIFQKRSHYLLLSSGIHALLLLMLIFLSMREISREPTFETVVHFETGFKKKSARIDKLPALNQTKTPSTKQSNIIKDRATEKREDAPSTIEDENRIIEKNRSQGKRKTDLLGYLRDNKLLDRGATDVEKSGLTKRTSVDSGKRSTSILSITKLKSALSKSRVHKEKTDPLFPAENRRRLVSNAVSGDEGTSSSKALSVWRRKIDTVAYKKALSQRISNNWTIKSKKMFTIEIESFIGPKGELLRTNVLRSSHLAIHDNSAIKAIRLSAPFPEFPKSFKPGMKEFRVVFRFTPGKGVR